jgi:tetratricopeptide (TPR) repeat protein
VFLYRQHRYDEAAAMFKQVIDLAPDNVRGYNNLCGVYIAVGQYVAATPVCARSVAIRPTQDAYLNLGNSYFYQRQFSDAADAYEKAVRLDERMASAWGNLADAYIGKLAHGMKPWLIIERRLTFVLSNSK